LILIAKLLASINFYNIIEKRTVNTMTYVINRDVKIVCFWKSIIGCKKSIF